MKEYIGKIVQLIYIDSKREVSIRNVKVLAVGEERFKAHCYHANEVRTFKLSGVVDVEVLNPRVLEVVQHARRHKSQGATHTV
jgi:predicted DNA-binding transcriptional regulator YafY